MEKFGLECGRESCAGLCRIFEIRGNKVRFCLERFLGSLAGSAVRIFLSLIFRVLLFDSISSGWS